MTRLDLRAMPGVTVTHLHGGEIEYAVPKIDGDPVAIRTLAGSCSDLADAINRSRLAAGEILRDLAVDWHGIGHAGLLQPADRFDTDAAGVQHALIDVADRLEEFAAELLQATEHHTSWWHRAMVIGAAVAVTAAAVTVTVSTGGAGAEAGALAATEAVDAVAGMADAVESAGDTAAVVAGELSESAAGLGRITELIGLFRSQLVTAQINAGMTAGVDELLHGKLGWRDVVINGLTGFAAADAIQGLTPIVDEALAELPAAVSWLAQHGVQGAVWGAATAASDLGDGGSVNGEDVGLGTATGSIGLLGREAHDLLSAVMTGVGQTGTSWLELSGDRKVFPDMQSAFRRRRHRKAEHMS